MANEKIQPLTAEVKVKLDYVVPESVTARVASQMTLQADGPMYVLGFWEVIQPVLMGTPQEVTQRVRDMESVPARCVARIYIDQDRLVQLAKLLRDNLPAGAKLE